MATRSDLVTKELGKELGILQDGAVHLLLKLITSLGVDVRTRWVNSQTALPCRLFVRRLHSARLDAKRFIFATIKQPPRLKLCKMQCQISS